MSVSIKGLTGAVLEKLPAPNLTQLKHNDPSSFIVKAGTLMGRIYSASGSFPNSWNEFRHWGPAGSRFDHHLQDANGQSHTQNRGIMYTAVTTEALQTCFAEYFQASRTFVSLRRNSPTFTGFKVIRTLKLLDLSGVFVTKMGASTAIHSGPRQLVQPWARALYEVYPDIDGILYCSSMNGNAQALALFERAKNAMPDKPEVDLPLNHPAMLKDIYHISQTLGYSIIED